ncbi:FAD-binding oxidoreductase [Aestuariivita sp.]|uniref:NAD(P)/FAD-dependent oxidoreductase n=1 Tax=Aestuariivita sp. TaxID=1872407 RepID=UPI0025BC5461|nr:FAD-binding oxidoreductase [Aestuariivita sp.]
MLSDPCPQRIGASPVIPNERPVIANSLWAATANRIPDYPALTGVQNTDVAVIGGGYTGLSAALHLAEAGVRVTLLEAEQPGWGASGRNGGQINPGLKDGPSGIMAKFGPEQGRRMAEMAGDAADLVFALIDTHQIACDAVRPGWIRAAHTEKTLRDLHALAEDWHTLGAPVDALDRAAITRITGTDTYLGGLIDRRGGNLHPLNYALGLADAAGRAGAVIHGQSPVDAIDRDGARYRLKTVRGVLGADTVLICTNAYSGDLERPLGRSVLPVRSVQVATAPLSDNLRASILPDRHALSDARRLLLYFRLDAEGRFVMGGRGTYNDGSTRRQIARLKAVTSQLFPQLSGVEWQHAWGGFVALTRDHYPHLHEIAPGLMAGLGYNGRGVAIATAMGRVLARWASGTPPKDLDFPVTPVAPLPFSFARTLAVEAEILRLRLLDQLGL